MSTQETKHLYIKRVVIITPPNVSENTKKLILEMNKWIIGSEELKALMQVRHTVKVERNANMQDVSLGAGITRKINDIIFSQFPKKDLKDNFISLVKRNVCSFVAEDHNYIREEICEAA